MIASRRQQIAARSRLSRRDSGYHGAIALTYNRVAYDRVALATNRGAVAAIAARKRLSRRESGYRGAIALTYDRVAHDRVALATNRGAVAAIAARKRLSRRDRAHLRSRRA